MRKVRIACIQAKADPRPERNLERAANSVRAAARRGARIVCLQELFRTPYFCRTESRSSFRLAETIPGPTTEAMGALARALGVVIIAPVFEKRGRGLYHNSAAVLDADGKLLGRYRKMHIPDDPHFYEKFYFAPGDLGWPVFRTRYADIGVLICWDQWYPEAARLVALGGAEILFYPTAIGAVKSERPAEVRRQIAAWKTMHTAHAVANGIYVAAANRTGDEGVLRFWGSSLVAAPGGEMLALSRKKGEDAVLADCDLDRITRLRQEWPFLRDRRIDAYRGLLSRYAGD